ncbi:hypothetical protein [Mucilaginibacter sp. HD30]
MKNPFKKKDNTLLIAGIAIGAAAASLAYLFLTESGIAVRQQLAGYFGQGQDDADDHEEQDPQAYMHHPGKAPKTDRDALLKNEILHNTDEDNAQS